ncbi:PAS domain-containing protein [Leptolyngbya ohadii]|uniref:PAS domain-containing protein n=1 Tax=Leptolyngbya ohadii TaxID=1962290 RepID=UPI000B599240|nr:PAS domain-containing protein [Leptolyngbya ohadii]
MVRATEKLASLLSRPLRQRSVLLLLGFLSLLLAHQTALLFRIQPAVSPWFPPSGVAIVLTLWLGPIGAVLTWIASFIVAPAWGNTEWARFASITDALEPLVAWFLFYRCFQATLSLKQLRNAIAFLISAPLIACGTSAVLGSLALVAFGKMSLASLPATVPHWWTGNAIGTMVIAPVALLFMPQFASRQERQDSSFSFLELPYAEVKPESGLENHSYRWLEVGCVLVSTTLFAILTVQATQVSFLATFQFSLLNIIPILWAVARFGIGGSLLTASYSVIVTLLAYLWVYPNAIALPAFPVSPELLYTHKLSLLMQAAVALIAGTAITERSAIQAALQVEKIKHAETESRARLSEELRRQKQELKTLLENSPDIIARVDREFRHVYVSPVIEEITGIPAKQFVGRTNRDLGFPEEICQAWEADLRAVFTTGQRRTAEFSFPLAEGGLRYYESRLIPELAADGSVQSVLGITRDVTDLKQVERSLRLANEQFRLASEAVNSAIYDWDIQQNRVERTSGMDRVFGYTPEDTQSTGEWYLTLIHPDDIGWVRERVQALFATGEHYYLEYRVRNRQGNYIHVADQGLVIRDHAGEVIRVVGSVADISEQTRLEAERRQVEAALQESEKRYRDLAEAMPQMVWMADATGAVTYWNQRWYAYTGIEETASLGLSGIETVHPDDRDRTLHQWNEAIRAGKTFEVEYRIRRLDGVYRWFISRAIPLRDSQGQIMTWIGTITDIEDQKRTQAELHQSKEQLSLALAAAQAGTWQWFKADNRTLWSDENFRLLGYEPGSVSSTYETWLNAVHPDDREMVQQAVNRAIEEQSLLYFEYRVSLPDGSERWLADRGQITHDAAGKPDGMIGIQIDITQRKQAEIALNQSQERLTLAMEAARMGSWDWNVQTGEVYWSPNLERLFGMAPGQFDGRYETVMAMIHPDDRQMVQQAVHHAIYGHQDYNIEFRFIKPDGTMRWAIGCGQVFYSATGVPLQMAGVDLDISERKQAELERAQLLEREQVARQQAESASRMKDEFLAIVSHELRSPLNGILGWSRLLRTRALDPNTTEKALASIERNAQAQTQLIEDLLDISRIIRGAVRLNVQPVSLIPIVHASLDTVRPTAEAKSIQLLAELDPSVGLLSGDADRLQQIIWNLLSNAVKFTPNGGRVRIQLRQGVGSGEWEGGKNREATEPGSREPGENW